MSAYKDKTQGTWYVSFRYIDWTGKKTQKLKRGFKTKKEALNYEKEFIRKTAADMKMEMNSFIQVYFEDKKNELKENSIRNKQHMMNKHIVPYFGTRKMNEITPAEIIQWQNTIQEKGYSKTSPFSLKLVPDRAYKFVSLPIMAQNIFIAGYGGFVTFVKSNAKALSTAVPSIKSPLATCGAVPPVGRLIFHPISSCKRKL